MSDFDKERDEQAMIGNINAHGGHSFQDHLRMKEFVRGADWAVEWFKRHYNFSYEIKQVSAAVTKDEKK